MSDGNPGEWVTETNGYPETVVSARGLDALDVGEAVVAKKVSTVRKRPQGRVRD